MNGERKKNTESISRKRSYNKTLVTDKDILIFGKQVLFFLFIAFIFCGVCGLYFKSQALLEIMKVEIPPLCTLVLGYYWGNDKK